MYRCTSVHSTKLKYFNLRRACVETAIHYYTRNVLMLLGGKIPPRPTQTADLPSSVISLQSYFSRGLRCTRTRVLQVLAAGYTSNNSTVRPYQKLVNSV